MRVWNTVDAWRERRRSIAGSSIGFVPTMGALHHGHASLVERCRKENDIAVVSIFVNPSQFNDPRIWSVIRAPSRAIWPFSKVSARTMFSRPPISDLYPNGYRFRVESETATQVMEGALRPGFLQGVMTIVLKLLNLVRADRAYFGEKDYQQLRTITEMVQDFFIPTEIVACPTVREPSGLAESSRNRLLSTDGREKAACLYRALTTAAQSRGSQSNSPGAKDCGSIMSRSIGADGLPPRFWRTCG